MKIWHVLENEEEVERMLDDREYEVGGAFVHPQTFRPHVHVTVKNWIGDSDVFFIIPLEFVRNA